MIERKINMNDLLDLTSNLNYLKSNLIIDWAKDLIEDSELRDLNQAVDELNYQLTNFMMLNKKMLETEEFKND